jgi:glycosyltransferase involved in cell wall biosynthesis
MRTLVSVIIPTYNRAYSLPLSLASVLAQSYNNIEIIVVDDNSSDNTAAVCQRFISEFGNNIQYVRNDTNLGPAASRNKGIELAQGDLVTFLDSDDLYYLDKIELQVELLEKNPSAGFCYGHFTCTTDLHEFNNYHCSKWLPPFNLYPTFLLPNNFYIVTPAVMVRTKLFDVVGKFNESLHICEDLELWSRILFRTEALCVTKPIVAIHIRHEEQIKFFHNILARDQLYQSVIKQDPALSNEFKICLYQNLIDLYLAIARNQEGRHSNTVNILNKMRAARNKPFDVMQSDIVQLATIGIRD